MTVLTVGTKFSKQGARKDAWRQYSGGHRFMHYTVVNFPPPGFRQKTWNK
jgi:hypothetical protein